MNLADARSGSAEIMASQVGPALAIHPDVVTITLFDDAERGTDPALVELDLGAVVTRLARLRSNGPGGHDTCGDRIRP